MDYSVALTNISLINVLIATVVAVIAGSIWYAEPVFGREWQKAAGLKKKDLKNANMTSAMVGMVASTLIAATFLSIVMSFVGQMDTVDGALFGALIAAFFILTAQATNYLFEQKSMTLLSINGAHSILTYALMGAVIASGLGA